MSDLASQRGRAVAALVTVQVLFGVHYSIAIEIMKEITPAVWALLRCAGGAVVLSAIVIASGRSWPKTVRDWGVLTWLALLGVAINQILFLEGISRSTAIHSVVVMSTIPLQTLTISALLGHERLSARKVASVLLGGVGMVILLRVDELIGAGSGEWLLRRDGSEADGFFETVLWGDLTMLANAFSFSLFLVLSKKPAARFDAVTMTAAVFITGTLIVALYSGAPALREDYRAISTITWGWCAFTIVGPTAGTYLLNFYAVKRVPSSMVGLFIYLQFVVASVVAVAWHGERFDWRVTVAAALVLVGLSLRIRRAVEAKPRD